MADETATTKLVFDATAALKGAQDLQRAVDQAVAAFKTVVAAGDNAAKATGDQEVKKANARAEGARKAKESATLEAAAAQAGADAVVTKQDRLLKSTSAQIAMLDRYARAWDPLTAAADRAIQQLERLDDVVQKTQGPVNQRATAMIGQAIDRAAQATLNQAAGFDINRVVGQFRQKFDADTVNAQKYGEEQQQLNTLLRVGAINAQTYAEWNAKLATSYDTAAQAAQRQKEAMAELIATTREQQEATQKAAEAQHLYNVGFAPGLQNQIGTVGGKPVYDQENESAKLRASMEEDAKAAEEANAALQQMADRMAYLSAKFDPVTASAKAMATEIAELNEYARAGGNIAGGYAAAYQAIIEKYDEGAQAAKRAAEAQRELIEQTRLAQETATKAADAQHLYNVGFAPGIQNQLGTVGGRPIYDREANSAAQSAAVFKENFDQQEKELAEKKRLTEAYDPLSTAAERYAAKLADIDKAEKLSILTAAEATAERAKEAKSYGDGATNLQTATRYLGNFRDGAFGARFAAQQLGVQTIQFFSSLQAGQPFLQAFIGQAHQIADVAITTGTGFGTLTTAVRGWISSLTGWVTRNPIVAGVAAATAAIVGLAAIAESRAQRMQALRNQLSAQRPDDFVQATKDADFAARRLAATTDTSSKEALAAMTALYRDPAFKGTPEQAVALASSFEKLSKAMGGTKPGSDALKEMLKDPAEFTKQLVAEFKELDPELARQAERFQNSGKEAQAFEVALKAVNEATKNVAQTPLSAALTRLAAAFHPVTTAAVGAAQAIGSVFTSLLTSLINDVAAIVETIGKIPSALASAASAIGRGLSHIIPPLPQGSGGSFVSVDEFGRQIPDLNLGRRAQPGAAAGSAAATSASGFANTAGDATRRANALTESLGLVSETVKKLQDNERLLTTALQQTDAATHPEKIKEYGEAIDTVRGKLYEAVSAQEAFVRQLEQSARVSKATTEGNAKFLQLQEQLNELNRRSPQGRDPQAEERARNAVLEESHGQLGKVTTEMLRQIEAQNKLTTAYGQGYGAAEKQNAENQALTESQKLYEDGSDDLANSLKNLARMHELLTSAMQKTAAAQRELANRDTLAFVQAETSTLGQNALARDRQLAQMKLQQDLMREFPNEPGTRAQLLQQGMQIFDRQQALEAANSINLITEALRKLQAQRDDVQRQLTAAQRAGNNPTLVQHLTEELKAYQGQIYQTVGPQEDLARSMEQQARVSQALTEGDQKLLQVKEQLDEIDRRSPLTQSAEMRARIFNAALQDQVNQYNKVIFEAGQQIAAQNRLTTAYADGYDAVAKMTAANQALAEAMRLFGTNIPLDKLKQLTEQYTALAAAQQNTQAAQMAAQQRDTITLMNAEIASLGEDSLARERNLNHIRTELELKRQMPFVSQEVRDALLKENDAIFAQQQALQVHQQAMSELEGSVSSAFDTLGNAITEPLKQGETAAQRLRTTVTSVVDDMIKQFMKMAVLNPLMNELFPSGQHRPTLTDLFEKPKPIQSTASETIKSLTGAGGLPLDPVTGAVKVIDVSGGLLGGGKGEAGQLLGTGTGAAVTKEPLAAISNAASGLSRSSIPGRDQLDLVQIASPSGVKFTVDRSVSEGFKGFLEELEGTGYKINQSESGGYNPRNIAGTNTPSLHAFGRAIDINSQENPHGASGEQNLPPDIADIARRWGLTWGGNWSGSTRDPMHFEVPLSGSRGTTSAVTSAASSAANDNGSVLTKAVSGGLPLDPMTGAMRCVIVSGGSSDLTGAAQSAANNATPLSANAAGNEELPLPPIPPELQGADTTVDPGTGALRVIQADGSGVQSFNDTVSAIANAGRGTGSVSASAATSAALSALGGQFGPETASQFQSAGGTIPASSGVPPAAATTGGDGILASAMKLLSGNWNPIFGKGFDEGGGLLGKLFSSDTKGSSDTAGSVDTGAAGSSGGFFDSLFGGIGKVFSGAFNFIGNLFGGANQGPKSSMVTSGRGLAGSNIFTQQMVVQAGQVSVNGGSAAGGGGGSGTGALGDVASGIGKLFGSGAKDVNLGTGGDIQGQDFPDYSGPSGVSPAVDEALARAGGTASDAASSGGGFFSGIGDAISGAWNWAGNAASGVGNWISNLFAAGGTFRNGEVQPISAFRNSMVHAATPFGFGHAVGLMGEAGSEAIMPMSRGGIQTTMGHVLPLGRAPNGSLAVDHMGAVGNWAKWAAGQGVGNDNMIAHINPREARVLRMLGGSGGLNPRTGLPHFDDGGAGGDSSSAPPPSAPAAAPEADTGPTIFHSSAEAIAAGYTPGNPMNGLNPSVWYKDATGGWGANASLANQYGAMTGASPYEEATGIQFDRGPAIMQSYGAIATQMANFPDNAVPLSQSARDKIQSIYWNDMLRDPRKLQALDPAVRWLTGGSTDLIATVGNSNFSIDPKTGMASLTNAGTSAYQGVMDWQTRNDILYDIKMRRGAAMGLMLPLAFGAIGLSLGAGAALFGAGAGAEGAALEGAMAADLPSAGAGAATGAGAGSLGSAAGFDLSTGAALAGEGVVDSGVWDLPGVAAAADVPTDFGASAGAAGFVDTGAFDLGGAAGTAGSTGSAAASQSGGYLFGLISKDSWLGQIMTFMNNPYIKALRLAKTLIDLPKYIQALQQSGQQVQRAAMGGVYSDSEMVKYHDGGVAGRLNTDEFPAVLQNGERVLTGFQNSQLESMLPHIANQNSQMSDMLTSLMPENGGMGARDMASMMQSMASLRPSNENTRGGDVTHNNGHTFHVNVSGSMNHDEARRTGYQIANAINSRLSKQTIRSNTR